MTIYTQYNQFLFTLALLLSAPLLSTPHIATPDDVVALFPTSTNAIQTNLEKTIDRAQTALNLIIAIPAKERSFENTVKAFDCAVADLMIDASIIHTLQHVHPDKEIRDSTTQAILQLEDFIIDNLENNKKVYNAFTDYLEGNFKQETLNAERQHHLRETMLGFRQSGITLEGEAFKRMTSLKKHIGELQMTFSSNIAQDQSKMVISEDALNGVDPDFIQSLPKEGNERVLRCDYPTQTHIMNHCHVESTRRDYARLFSNRAFPQNLNVLNQLINARDQLAQILGFKSYAEMDTSNQMIKSPEGVLSFLDQATPAILLKASQEWESMLFNMPNTISLTANGKIQSWDGSYLSTAYQKAYMNVDDAVIAEYFPVESTINSLLEIYEIFFSLKFTAIPCDGLWDDNVRLIEVKTKDKTPQLLGYLLLDLFPRSNKYSHACCDSLVPPIVDEKGTISPAVAVVIANFSKPNGSKPALLKYSEVRVFFHEFGHAIHALLGRAEMPTRAAYHTVIDFVEAPSQLLEEWLEQPSILKRISRHYVKGEPLSDELIGALIDSKHFELGRHTSRQLVLAHLSLAYFQAGQNKDPMAIRKEIFDRFSTYEAFDELNHFPCSFGHLTMYGARYYSYLWSKEIAHKIFEYIQTHGGPLDPIVGQRYIAKVIGRGGSCDANDLVADFLEEK
ncbi:MAG: Zn-dependent oligopeptidase [Parachlamydiaceae bacterium]|nr:Zn-dependent oligopeptidase [Parachlamydiaceae bacterium]